MRCELAIQFKLPQQWALARTMRFPCSQAEDADEGLPAGLDAAGARLKHLHEASQHLRHDALADVPNSARL